ncbi:hypothetical protein AAF712_016695, partial [Marasmius tenuissimus]
MNHDLPNLFAAEFSRWAKYPFFVAEHVLVALVVLTFFLLSLGIVIGLILVIAALCWWIKWLILDGTRLVGQFCGPRTTVTEEQSTSSEDTNTSRSQSTQTSPISFPSPARKDMAIPGVATPAQFTGIAASSYERVARRVQAPETPPVLSENTLDNIHVSFTNHDGIPVSPPALPSSSPSSPPQDNKEPTSSPTTPKSAPEPRVASSGLRIEVAVEVGVEERTDVGKEPVETRALLFSKDSDSPSSLTPKSQSDYDTGASLRSPGPTADSDATSTPGVTSQATPSSSTPRHASTPPSLVPVGKGKGKGKEPNDSEFTTTSTLSVSATSSASTSTVENLDGQECKPASCFSDPSKEGGGSCSEAKGREKRTFIAENGATGKRVLSDTDVTDDSSPASSSRAVASGASDKDTNATVGSLSITTNATPSTSSVTYATSTADSQSLGTCTTRPPATVLSGPTSRTTPTVASSLVQPTLMPRIEGTGSSSAPSSTTPKSQKEILTSFFSALSPPSRTVTGKRVSNANATTKTTPSITSSSTTPSLPSVLPTVTTGGSNMATMPPTLALGPGSNSSSKVTSTRPLDSEKVKSDNPAEGKGALGGNGQDDR